ncbi:hypothetical protein B0H17DRAFT_1143582 [Mycena rosella]|uniref:CxC2-like cysteine cluster KDZ transposase-associated domain-containing protein n=1 Tax=Mycena rosella TaxID=1033263 RepID=A0AAD7CUQ4_MYCRO|nr:hypothetical protein B0H17DRAFT_1143582 [Mycena rosella]
MHANRAGHQNDNAAVHVAVDDEIMRLVLVDVPEAVEDPGTRLRAAEYQAPSGLQICLSCGTQGENRPSELSPLSFLQGVPRGQTLVCVVLYCGPPQAPLHYMREWNGRYWRRRTLGQLGFVFQLGHNGFNCPAPRKPKQVMTVLAVDRFHDVQFRYCNCPGHANQVTQLLQVEWFPTWGSNIANCVMFEMLGYRLRHTSWNLTATSMLNPCREMCLYVAPSKSQDALAEEAMFVWRPISVSLDSFWWSRCYANMRRVLRVERDLRFAQRNCKAVVDATKAHHTVCWECTSTDRYDDFQIAEYNFAGEEIEHIWDQLWVKKNRHKGLSQRKVNVLVGHGDEDPADIEAYCAVYISTNGNRRAEELLNVAHKKRRLGPKHLQDVYAKWIPVDAEEECEEETANQISGVPDSLTSPAKRKAYTSSNDPMAEWHPMKQLFLDETLGTEGLGYSGASPSCALCTKPLGLGLRNRFFKCAECGDCLQCKSCCIKQHGATPLHSLKHWTGDFWEDAKLADLGFVYQVGHKGLPCPFPEPELRKMTVIHTSGIHQIRFRYCKCSHGRSLSNLTQLLRNKWYLATE